MAMKNSFLVFAILFSAFLIAASYIYSVGLKYNKGAITDSAEPRAGLTLDAASIELPVRWNDLGKQLTGAGVIDAQKFEELYSQRGGLNNKQKKMLYAEDNGNLVISKESSGIILNLLWALGLANKNEILEEGPMVDSRYGGAQNFASTAGWTLAKGDAMAHYSQHRFITLTAEQQALVEKVAKNIYRPCCSNSTHFPDCNHGMAMLGFLEMAASQGATENALYRMALILNSYWFPDTYLTVAKYLENRGTAWEKIDAKEVLGFNFSSASGYQRILAQTAPAETKGGGSCGA